MDYEVKADNETEFKPADLSVGPLSEAVKTLLTRFDTVTVGWEPSSLTYRKAVR